MEIYSWVELTKEIEVFTSGGCPLQMTTTTTMKSNVPTIVLPDCIMLKNTDPQYDYLPMFIDLPFKVKFCGYEIMEPLISEGLIVRIPPLRGFSV